MHHTELGVEICGLTLGRGGAVSTVSLDASLTVATFTASDVKIQITTLQDRETPLFRTVLSKPFKSWQICVSMREKVVVLSTAKRGPKVLQYRTQHEEHKFLPSALSASILKLDGFIVWKATIQYLARSVPLCVQAVYFPHSMMPSVTCLRLSDVSLICRVILIFSFQFRSVFFHVGQPGRTGLSNIGHWTLQKFG